MAASGDIFDGYRLIRPIGRGGFGEVWLCRLEATGEFKALKFLPASDSAQLERELGALIRYRTVASDLQCPNLLAIEHVNRTPDGLFYVMPLADGTSESPADDPRWQPWTLAALIAHRKDAPTWFSVEEIRAIILPLIDAVQRLSDAGVVHRDIKPENILFVGRRPYLGDISLLTDDAATITRRGTPGYAAPSWYLESGGSPDMWGLATTLYSLVTGNHPDKLGRAAFLWPPQGEASVDQETWNHFHRVIFRAVHEEASERYLRFEDFAAALVFQKNGNSEPILRSSHTRRSAVLACTAIALVCGYFFWPRSHPEQSAPPGHRSADTASSGNHSEFDTKATAATKDFEVLLKEAQTKFSSNPSKSDVEKFKALVSKLNSQSQAGRPLEEIQKIIFEIDQFVPGLRKEPPVFDRKEFNGFVERLYKAAHQPEALAKNADEGFRGKRIADALLGKALDFQNEVEQQNTARISSQSNLTDTLSSTISVFHDARLAQMEAEEKKMQDAERALDEERKSLQARRDQLHRDYNSKQSQTPKDEVGLKKLDDEIQQLDGLIQAKYDQIQKSEAAYTKTSNELSAKCTKETVEFEDALKNMAVSETLCVGSDLRCSWIASFFGSAS